MANDRRWSLLKIDERDLEAMLHALIDGWEPFAVIPLAPCTPSGDAYCTVWLKKLVDREEGGTPGSRT